MPTLRPEVKKKWTEALRSGRFDQGAGQLRDLSDNYCCLGVLCQIAVEEGVIPPAQVAGDGSDYAYGNPSVLDTATGVLPLSVQEWAYEDVVTETGPNFQDPILGGHNASTWNDDYEADFKKIASLIEEHL